MACGGNCGCKNGTARPTPRPSTSSYSAAVLEPSGMRPNRGVCGCGPGTLAPPEHDRVARGAPRRASPGRGRSSAPLSPCPCDGVLHPDGLKPSSCAGSGDSGSMRAGSGRHASLAPSGSDAAGPSVASAREPLSPPSYEDPALRAGALALAEDLEQQRRQGRADASGPEAAPETTQAPGREVGPGATGGAASPATAGSAGQPVLPPGSVVGLGPLQNTADLRAQSPKRGKASPSPKPQIGEQPSQHPPDSPVSPPTPPPTNPQPDGGKPPEKKCDCTCRCVPVDPSGAAAPQVVGSAAVSTEPPVIPGALPGAAGPGGPPPTPGPPPLGGKHVPPMPPDKTGGMGKGKAPSPLMDEVVRPFGVLSTPAYPRSSEPPKTPPLHPGGALPGTTALLQVAPNSQAGLGGRGPASVLPTSWQQISPGKDPTQGIGPHDSLGRLGQGARPDVGSVLGPGGDFKRRAREPSLFPSLTRPTTPLHDHSPATADFGSPPTLGKGKASVLGGGETTQGAGVDVPPHTPYDTMSSPAGLGAAPRLPLSPTQGVLPQGPQAGVSPTDSTYGQGAPGSGSGDLVLLGAPTPPGTRMGPGGDVGLAAHSGTQETSRRLPPGSAEHVGPAVGVAAIPGGTNDEGADAGSGGGQPRVVQPVGEQDTTRQRLSAAAAVGPSVGGGGSSAVARAAEMHAQAAASFTQARIEALRSEAHASAARDNHQKAIGSEMTAARIRQEGGPKNIQEAEALSDALYAGNNAASAADSEAVKAVLTAERAASLSRAATEQALREGSLVERLLIENPTDGAARLDEEIARQSSPAAQYRRRRDAIRDDRLEAGRGEAREVRRDRELAGLPAGSEQQRSALRERYSDESAAHAARQDTLNQLDGRQETLEVYAKFGLATPNDLKELARLRADGHRREAEREKMARRDLTNTIQLRNALTRRLRRIQNDPNKGDEADALRREIGQLDAKIKNKKSPPGPPDDKTKPGHPGEPPKPAGGPGTAAPPQVTTDDGGPCPIPPCCADIKCPEGKTCKCAHETEGPPKAPPGGPGGGTLPDEALGGSGGGNVLAGDGRTYGKPKCPEGSAGCDTTTVSKPKPPKCPAGSPCPDSPAPAQASPAESTETTKNCTVPNLIGMKENPAKDLSAESGFSTKPTHGGRLPSDPNNIVVTGQDLPPGSRVPCSSQLNVSYGDPADAVVPIIDMKFWTRGDAEKWLKDHGLTAEFIGSKDSHARILGQFPPPGFGVAGGQTVRVALGLTQEDLADRQASAKGIPLAYQDAFYRLINADADVGQKAAHLLATLNALLDPKAQGSERWRYERAAKDAVDKYNEAIRGAERAATSLRVAKAYSQQGFLKTLGYGLTDFIVGTAEGAVTALTWGSVSHLPVPPLLPDETARHGGFAIGLTTGIAIEAYNVATTVAQVARAVARGGRATLAAAASGRLGTTAGTRAADETITVFRGMKQAEFEALERSGVLTSKGQRFGSLADDGLAARIRHSWGPSFRPGATSPIDTPYVSTSEISRLAGGYGKGTGDVVVKLVLKRSDVLRGLNPNQAEILVRGGARVSEYAVVPEGALSWGPRGALVRSVAVTGAAVAPAGVAGYLIGEKLSGDK